MPNSPAERFEILIHGMSKENIILLARSINAATPEQQAQAMLDGGPEAEEWGRKFEDAGQDRKRVTL